MEAHRPMHGDKHAPSDIIPLSILGKAGWLIVKIIVPLLLGVVLITPFFFDGWMILIADFTAVMLCFFIAIPLFLATLEDELIEEESTEHMQHAGPVTVGNENEPQRNHRH